MLANTAPSGAQSFAPVVLFAYNRQSHLQSTIEALRENAEASASSLYVFSDAAKAPKDEPLVEAVRKYLRQLDGFSEVHVIERPDNFGLARSIISGVTQVCNQHGRVIVLEDDMIVSPFFLRFMNEALHLYEHDERVVSVHGYLYPISLSVPETFFLRAAHCWGWATWARGWSLFESSGQLLMDEMKRRRLTKQFDFGGSSPYTAMLRDQIEGKNNSWAIRWYASAFLQDKLTLYPGRSLVHNTGMDGSGVHCSVTDRFSNGVAQRPIVLEGISVEENGDARRAIAEFFASTKRALPVRIAARFLRAAGIRGRN